MVLLSFGVDDLTVKSVYINELTPLGDCCTKHLDKDFRQNIRVYQQKTPLGHRVSPLCTTVLDVSHHTTGKTRLQAFCGGFVQFVKLHSPQQGKVDIFCASTTVADTKTHHPNRVRFEWCAFLCCAVGAGHVRPCRVRQTYAYGKAAGRACPAPTWEAAFYSVGSVVVSPAAAAASAAAWAKAA